MTGRPSRVLVTGGAGFIGSHLCAALLERGDEVLCLDDFSSGARANIEGLLGHPRFTMIESDVTRPFAARPDRIFNLACPASPKQYQRDPIGTLRTCVIGAMNMLDLAQSTGALILQASTSEVYGDPEMHPQPERYWGNVNPIGPRACYDEGKRCAETLFFDYRRQHGLRIKVARIFNTYGPHMRRDDGRVVSNFAVQALLGQPLAIHGDGSQTRSFCYVSDTVRGLLALMDTPDDVTGPVNIGNPHEISIRTLAEVMNRLSGSRAQSITLPPAADDPRKRKPDIALAQTIMGWQPEVGLEDGLRRTIAYFRGVIADERSVGPMQATG